jgi:hypothetical protein
MDRKQLIQRYLDAETTAEEERLLAESFTSAPPRDEEERKVEALLQTLQAPQLEPLPDAPEEYDSIVRRARRRAVLRWGLGVSGAAAAVAAAVLLTRTPPAHSPDTDTETLLEKLQLISDMDPAGASNYEFRPVGDGFIMTAIYEDGQTASFILTPIDGGNSYAMLLLDE